MARGAQGTHGIQYGIAAAMLVLALLFPIGLMIFNPTLMFERGWEQYLGTGIYLWAVLTLGHELIGLWRNEPRLRGGAGAARPGRARHDRESCRSRRGTGDDDRDRPAHGDRRR